MFFNKLPDLTPIFIGIEKGGHFVVGSRKDEKLLFAGGCKVQLVRHRYGHNGIVISVYEKSWGI